MVSDRMAVVLALLDGDRARGTHLPASVAGQAVLALGVEGICAGRGTGPAGMVLAWGQEPISAALEELQFTLGQGPGPDAAAGATVLIPDLLGAAVRWPAFAPAAAALGVRALFAVPLRIGAISAGVLLAHRATPGPLAAGALADTLALADTVTVLLVHQHATSASRPAPVGGPPPGWARPAAYRAQVHQATGMISVQLGVSPAEALAHLRAHAYADGRLLAEVAADVVARRLRFDQSDL